MCAEKLMQRRMRKPTRGAHDGARLARILRQDIVFAQAKAFESEHQLDVRDGEVRRPGVGEGASA